MSQTRDQVFISYSHLDKKWLETFKTILQPMIRNKKITVWDDTRIDTGTKWLHEIKTALERTKVALLLVSGNFLNSDFIMDEELPVLLKAAENNQCRIFWVVIKECLYDETPLQQFQAAHDIKQPLAELTPAKADRVITHIARKLETEFNTPQMQAEPQPHNQVKVLSITAAPADDLQYEREQDILLASFRPFSRERVCLEIPDPVESTLTEIRQRLGRGGHDVLMLTAHGQVNETGDGFLCLENAQGEETRVTGKELMGELQDLPRQPKIIILNSCHSARPEPSLEPVAQTLFQAGIHTVLGMKRSVSHEAVMEFNRAFFHSLCSNLTIGAAFRAGQEAVKQMQQQKRRDNPDWPFRDEEEIPVLLSRDEGLTAAGFYPHRIDAPPRPQSHQFQGAKYLERGFIGRRALLRRIYKQVEPEGAVVLKGPGGIGKSTVTTRVAGKLRRQGYEFIVVRGSTSIVDILEKISSEATHLGIPGADGVFAAQADEGRKLGWLLENFLLTRPVVVIFDNFEDNQDAEAEGDFINEELKQFMWFFREALVGKRSVLFISTRYSLPGFGPQTIEVGELSSMEASKLLRNGRALNQLDGESSQGIMVGLGGNPRVMELLDGIAYREFGSGIFNWQKLRDLFPEMKRRMLEEKTKDDDFTPLMLAMLLEFLTPPQQRLLEAVSIYRVPVPFAALAVQGVKNESQHRLKLEDLSLLLFLKEEGMYYIHRLTAGYVQERMAGKKRKQAHGRAAEYFNSIRDEENNIELSDAIEARHHFLQAEAWDRATDITASLINYLTLHGFPRRSMELLGQLPLERLSGENRIGVIGEMGSLHMHFGDYNSAVTCFQRALQMAEAGKDLRKSAAILNQLGMLHQEQGRYDEAGEHYRKSMEIKEKIGDIKGVAVTLHQLGMLHQHQGRSDEAGEHYRKSMEIKEKIGDIKGVAQTLHQLGMLHQHQGRSDEAGEHYRKSMEIAEKIGDIKGVAQTLHQLGMLHQHQGRSDEAGEHYRKSMEIKEKIGDINGIALSLAQTGNLLLQKKQFAEALDHFARAYAIFNQLQSPYAKKAIHFINEIKKNLAEEKFNALLNQHNLDPETLAAEE